MWVEEDMGEQEGTVRAKNRGEKEKRSHNTGSHYRFKEKSGTRELSRDL